MSRDVLTVGSTMRIPLLYREEYSHWVERFMNYLEEQTDGEAMINSIKNGDQLVPRVTQVSIAGTTSTEQPPLKDKSMWFDQEKRVQKIDRLGRSLLIQGLTILPYGGARRKAREKFTTRKSAFSDEKFSSQKLLIWSPNTGHALINFYEGELTLRVGKESVTFNRNQTSRYSANYDAMSVNRIDLIHVACKEYSQEILRFSVSGNPTPSTETIFSNSSPTLTSFGESDLLLEETDAFLAIDDEPISPEIDKA
nr:reverse transcriptase domain-containing protein [Tanacetum cinerariifolium]